MALTDFEAIVRTYMEERLKESYPEIASSGSTLSDLYINPFIEINKPLILLLSKIDRMQSLYNYNYMTVNELDVIGSGNHGVFRMAGSRASGYVYVEMDPQYVGPEPVVIPVISVESADKLKFKSRATTIIKFSEDDVITIIGTVAAGIAADYLNVPTGKYEFPVYVEAEEEGEAYNVEANSLTTLLTPYALLTGVVTNKEPFTNGVALETNESYATRIKQEPVTRAVGTKAWYRNYVLKNYPDVCNVYVAGYGNSMMTRDLLVMRGDDGFKETHIGGKVDLYIVGSDIQTITQSAYIKSDTIRLENPLLKNEDAILFNNITNPDNNDLAVNLIYEFPETKTGYLEAQVVAGGSSVLPSPGDELEVRHISYLDDTYTDTFAYIQRFYYKSNRIRLLGTPFKAMVSITNETTGEEVSLDGTFEIERVLPRIETALCPDQTECTLSELKLNPSTCLAITDYYKGHTVKIVEGTGAGQSRVISNYTATTLVATLNYPWDIKPNTISKYSITSYTNKKENSAKDTVDIVCNMESLKLGTVDYNFDEGDLLTLEYTHNKLIADVQEDNDVREIRGIGADVLAREAIPEYLYVGLMIKCKHGRLLTSDQKVIIQSVIEDEIVGADFESDLQMSDLINILYQVPEVSTFMDYIVMPPVFFSSPEILPYTDEELVSLVDPEFRKSVVTFEMASYPVLAKCVIVDAG